MLLEYVVAMKQQRLLLLKTCDTSRQMHRQPKGRFRVDTQANTMLFTHFSAARKLTEQVNIIHSAHLLKLTISWSELFQAISPWNIPHWSSCAERLQPRLQCLCHQLRSVILWRVTCKPTRTLMEFSTINPSGV